jgi:hypothetical protein
MDNGNLPKLLELIEIIVEKHPLILFKRVKIEEACQILGIGRERFREIKQKIPVSLMPGTGNKSKTQPRYLVYDILRFILDNREEPRDLVEILEKIERHENNAGFKLPAAKVILQMEQ